MAFEKEEILSSWIQFKIEFLEDILACCDVAIENLKIEAEPIELESDNVHNAGAEWQEWVQTKQQRKKALDFLFMNTPYDIENPATLSNIRQDCCEFIDHIKCLDISKMDVKKFEEIENGIAYRARFVFLMMGYQVSKHRRKVTYEEGPGTMSRELGETTIQRSIEVLAKYGGIDGYRNLPRGKKDEVRNAIEKKLNLKDPRHVYNILKKIKNSPKTT